MFILKISEQIEKTYKDFEVFFKEELNLDLKKLDMSEVRDKFKELVLKDDPIFTEENQAEDSFLYIYHYRELQEIKRVSNYLLELNQRNLYEKFMMEFFNDSSPSITKASEDASSLKFEIPCEAIKIRTKTAVKIIRGFLITNAEYLDI